MTNYTKFAVRGATTIFFISLLAASLGYIVRFLLARNLTVEDFGLFYAVFAFLGLIGVFKSLGLDQALVKFIPEFLYKKRDNYIKSSIVYTALILFITNVIVIIGIYLLSDYLSVNFFHSNKASIVLRLMAIAFFIDSFVLLIKHIFQSFKKMTYYAGIDLLRMLLILAIILIGLKIHYGLIIPIIAYVLTPFILFILFSFLLLKKIYPNFFKSKFIFDKDLFKKISKFGFFVISASLGTIVLGYTDTIVLTFYAGLVNVGLYNIAFPTANILSYFPKAIVTVIMPLTAELWVKKKKELIIDGIESLYKYSIIVIFPAALIMVSFTDLLITLLFGIEFLPANTTLKILSFGMILGVVYGPNFAFFSGIGKPQIISKIVYTAAIFNLIGNLALIPIFGILGAAITTVLSRIIMFIMSLIYIKKFIKLKFPIIIWAKTFLAGFIFIIFIWFFKKVIYLNVWLETATVLAISGIIYIASLFVMKIININELKVIYNRIFN